MTRTGFPDDKYPLFQIIASLVPAGAERLVVHLLEYLDRERFAPVCISLTDPVGSHLEARYSSWASPSTFWARGTR